MEAPSLVPCKHPCPSHNHNRKLPVELSAHSYAPPSPILLRKSSELHSKRQWYPRTSLPHFCSSHPFDQSCDEADLQLLRSMCTQPLSSMLIQLRSNTLETITTKDLRNLLSHNSTITQQAINLYLHLLSHQFTVFFLDSAFFTCLKAEGWPRVARWFRHPGSPRRRGNKPRPSGESSISFACHINGCHWVAVTQREILGSVVFLYADNMNSLSTEQLVKKT